MYISHLAGHTSWCQYHTIHLLPWFLPRKQITRLVNTYIMTRSPYALPKLVCKGPSFFLNVLDKRGITPKIYRVMLLALQLHFGMMSKYSKFGVELLIHYSRYFLSYWVLVRRQRRRQRRQSSDNNSSTFSSKQTS